ncbi:MAG TPA: HAD-IIA family hydrolase, partial [Acidimicrobiales bacterium]|nr:HAD-IIA family hydrolase [Acidimicrobiales bacterium]
MPDQVLLDIDGVLTVSWDPLPGAVEAIRWLQAHNIEFRLVTNTSSKSRQRIAALLAAAGMPIEADRILTAVTSAARYLEEHHAGVGCLVVNEGDLGADLEGVAPADASSAGVVLLGGAGPSVGYPELDAVFKLAVGGVPIVALHRNVRYQTSEGPALDMGAFIVGIEAAAQVEVTVVGKPAPAFFQAAVADMGRTAAGTVMVGDDIDADVLGAQAVGMTGVLVRTGKFRQGDLDGAAERPDHVIDGIGDLPG